MHTDITQIFEETARELSTVSQHYKENESAVTGMLQYVYTQYIALVEYINDSGEEIQEINRIKDNKLYLKKYISAFELNLKFYKITQDENNIHKMSLNIWLFNLYIDDIDEFYKFQTNINTFFLSSPEKSDKYKNLKRQGKEITESDKEFMQQYQNKRHLKSILKFFRYRSLTSKNIMTSLSIVLYKALIDTKEIKKHQAKNILETMFHKLEYPTTIRINEMSNIYIKVVIDKLPIFAYHSSTDKESIYDFNMINKILLSKKENCKESPSKTNKYQHYIDTYIATLQKKLGF